MKRVRFGAARPLDLECAQQSLEKSQHLDWLGFGRYDGMSKISFADCAHARIGMLTDDQWLRKAPIVQYGVG